MGVAVALAAIHREGRLFLQRRDPKGKVLPGLWELPGGKQESGECLEETLLRELAEELDWAPGGFHRVGEWPGAIGPLVLFLVEGGGHPSTRLAWGWFSPEEALGLELPPVTREILCGILGNIPPQGLVPASMWFGNTTRESP